MNDNKIHKTQQQALQWFDVVTELALQYRRNRGLNVGPAEAVSEAVSETLAVSKLHELNVENVTEVQELSKDATANINLLVAKECSRLNCNKLGERF